MLEIIGLSAFLVALIIVPALMMRSALTSRKPTVDSLDPSTLTDEDYRSTHLVDPDSMRFDLHANGD